MHLVLQHDEGTKKSFIYIGTWNGNTTSPSDEILSLMDFSSENLPWGVLYNDTIYHFEKWSIKHRQESDVCLVVTMETFACFSGYHQSSTSVSSIIFVSGNLCKCPVSKRISLGSFLKQIKWKQKKQTLWRKESGP